MKNCETKPQHWFKINPKTSNFNQFLTFLFSTAYKTLAGARVEAPYFWPKKAL